MKKALKQSTIYTRAAKLIEERGLTKKAFQNRGRFCILGACTKADNTTVEDSSPFLKNRFPILKRVSVLQTGKDVVPFNDSPKTTKQDVINLLKLAAKQARKLGK